MRRNLLLHILAVVFSSIFFLASAQAQYRASLQGTVTDPQGAVVPDSDVTLTNTETGRQQQAKSSPNGVYNFNGLSPSVYIIKIEKSGFKQKVLENIQVIAEQANAVNVIL